MSDDDKTVFQRPTPGKPRGDRAGSAGHGANAPRRPNVGGANAPRQRGAASRPTPAYAQQPAASAEVVSQKLRDLNPIVNAASTLLGVYHQIKMSPTHGNVDTLNKRLIIEIQNFESALRAMNARQEILLSARYAMCSMLDEAVLNTPWGGESSWAQRSLLSTFHSETSGGEKFFLILDRLRQQPAENIDLLELMYIILSIGFEGRYRFQERGFQQLEQMRAELFNQIRLARGDSERRLSPTWRGLGASKKSFVDYLPMWVVAAAFAATILLIFAGFRVLLNNKTNPVAEQLEMISSSHQEAIDKAALFVSPSDSVTEAE